MSGAKRINEKKPITDIEQIDVNREILEIIKGYPFRNLTPEDINYAITDHRVTFNILNYTHVESVEELCTTFVDEISITVKDALALNVTTILDNAEDLFVQKLADKPTMYVLLITACILLCIYNIIHAIDLFQFSNYETECIFFISIGNIVMYLLRR